MAKPTYEVIVFGATSFVGQILCRYLVDQFGVGKSLRWAAAGRSIDKLKALKAELGDAATGLELVIADAGDVDALEALVNDTQVVVSTVGPYALYGEPLVQLCAESGTDYCDLTGEVQWIARMLERHEGAAKASGARIVHSCGFDSIPSDLGVYFLQQQARERFGSACTRVKMRVKAMRGGFSGGTAASLLNVVKEAVKDPALRKALGNPYLICPPGHPAKARQPNLKFAAYDKDFGSWMAPFVMAAINTRIVQRSNALLDPPYADEFIYDEAALTGKGLKGRLSATTMATALGGFIVASGVAPTRYLLERFFLPAAGEGPSPKAQEKGFFDLRFFGQTAEGQSIRCKVTGDRDPGYGSTAKMLGQAAACLAHDIDRKSKGGGFWTPASIFGQTLIGRLQAYAGLSFSVIE
ncbi:MAG: saccharopine dehydrogenase NADP-binding domain-containing protein [Xanthomonadales bacterium]|nr:saccharopine dehydrogenase NADP-binding domain-containing protein [Xanthomonadales bacterium]